MSQLYKKAALGGTFDRLHKGHEHLLQTALATAQELLIGLTTESLTRSKLLTSLIGPYDVRESQLRTYLTACGALDRCTIVPLTDVYGTTLTDPLIDMLVVTEQTLPGAGAINAKRQELSLSALPITVANLVKDSSGTYLSSSRIRQGVVNRSGQVYLDVFAHDYLVTPEQKKLLSQPLGTLVATIHDIPEKDLSNAPCVGLVGDVVTAEFKANQLPFTYAIVDGHTKRQSVSHTFGRTTLSVLNPAGMITSEAVTAVRQLTTLPKGVLYVEGEEDLVGFPLAFSLPLDSILIYGQPDQGVVYQILSEAKKNELFAIFNDRIDS